MCYFTYELMKLSSWSCQSCVGESFTLHIAVVSPLLGWSESLRRIVPLSVSGGRSGSSRKARGGLQAAEEEMSPDKCWHE